MKRIWWDKFWLLVDAPRFSSISNWRFEGTLADKKRSSWFIICTESLHYCWNISQFLFYCHFINFNSWSFSYKWGNNVIWDWVIIGLRDNFDIFGHLKEILGYQMNMFAVCVFEKEIFTTANETASAHFTISTYNVQQYSRDKPMMFRGNGWEGLSGILEYNSWMENRNTFTQWLQTNYL